MKKLFPIDRPLKRRAVACVASHAGDPDFEPHDFDPSEPKMFVKHPFEQADSAKIIVQKDGEVNRSTPHGEVERIACARSIANQLKHGKLRNTVMDLVQPGAFVRWKATSKDGKSLVIDTKRQYFDEIEYS